MDDDIRGFARFMFYAVHLREKPLDCDCQFRCPAPSAQHPPIAKTPPALLLLQLTVNKSRD